MHTSDVHVRRRRSRVVSLLPAFALLIALLATGCFGMVVEPAEGDYASGNIDVWGYSITSGGRVEVQGHDRVSDVWRTVRTTTASTVRTYAGTASGYSFQTTVSRSQLSSRYRYPGANASTRTVRLRVLIDGQQQPALTRASSRGEVWSSLNDLWNKVQADTRGVIQVSIPN